MPPVGCRWSTIHTIIRDMLQLRKLSCQRVPCILTNNHMTRHLGMFLQFLTLYHGHGEDIQDQVITRDEMWVNYYAPTTKEVSKHWVKKCQHPRVKAKTERSVNKHLMTVFWDRKCVILTS